MPSNIYQSEFTGSQMDTRLSAVATLQEAVTALETAVAAKYQKPAEGIPSTDMDAAVQNALAKALTAVQSLADYYTKSETDALLAAIAASVNATSGVTASSLPDASASTVGKMYYIGPDGNGEYSRYVTAYDGSTYSWLSVGTTDIDLTQYATKAEVSQLDQEVDQKFLYTKQNVVVADLPKVNYAFVTANGIWAGNSAGNTRNGSFVDVVPGDVLKIVGGDNAGQYSFLTEHPETVESRGTPPLVAGTILTTFGAGETVIVTIPPTCYCLNIMRVFNNIDNSPASIDFVIPLNAEIDEIEREMLVPVDISQLQPTDAIIGSTNVWSVPSSSTCVFLPLVAGKKYKCENKTSFSSNIAVLTTNVPGTNGAAPSWASGFSERIVINSGDSYSFIAPEGNNYLYIRLTSGTDPLAPNVYNNSPSTFAKEVAEELKQIPAIENTLGTAQETPETLTVATGSYIHNSGAVVEFASGRISSPVLLNAGDIIRITGKANSAVSVLSNTDQLGTSYTPILIGSGPASDTEDYSMEYTVQSSGYYAVCSIGTDPTLSLVEYSGLLKTVRGIEEEMAADSTDGINIISAFDNLVCVGDSLTWSQVFVGDGVSDQRRAKRPYPEVLAALCGNEYQILAASGDSAKSCWGTNGASIVAKENPLAIIYLGTNLGITDTLETDVVGDDPDEWADNNTGCYCRFVQKFQSLGYRVLLIKIWATSGTGESDEEHSNSAITHIGERFGCAVVDCPVNRDYKYHCYPDYSGRNNVHYNDLGYAWFASALIKSVSNLPTSQMKLIVPV